MPTASLLTKAPGPDRLREILDNGRLQQLLANLVAAASTKAVPAD